ncbi:MAG: long-chain fatty acid--CoA ligase [Desulfobacteraceae bacterium]|jgi:long-chain acyl-CoA synthetase|nr:MAG: long-chain fatty acid--CoA ligase [Desulfobacteraceae bacterium]
MKSIYSQKPWLKNYPDRVPHEMDVPTGTSLDDFKAAAAARAYGPAVYYFDYPVTYGEMERLSSGFAAALVDLGVKKGDRIVVDLQNIPQFPIAVYGSWKAGATVVPINPMYKEREISYFLKDSGSTVFLVMEETAAGLDLNSFANTSLKHVITASALDFIPQGAQIPGAIAQLQKIRLPGTLDMMEIIRKYDGLSVADPGLGPSDLAYLTYTSGTTGPPKGAMNTHGNIAFNARVYEVMQKLEEDDVILGVAPLFHVTGEVAHLASAALMAIPVILYYRFDPAETLRLIERWKATTTVAAITVYIALMGHPDMGKRNLKSLVKAYSGGAPVSDALVKRFEEVTGLYIYNVYGMTETNSPSHIVPWGMRAPVDRESGALSVGVPVPNCTARIMDLENGAAELPPGSVGEIVETGPIVVPGYWNKPDETRHAIREGWLYTGDVGKMDQDGWFYLVDRKKDMIVASGFKVWPRDVEDVIYQHPAVREAAVVGEPDPYRGETVKAYVALKSDMEGSITPEEIISFCKARMAAYKYPRSVEFVPEIPKTLTGKFLRRSLRERGNEGKGA